MTLILILLCIGLEHYYGSVERLRDWGWLHAWATRLQARVPGFVRTEDWHGAVGLLAVLVPPLLLAGIVFTYLDDNAYVLGLIPAFAVLLYCLGPRDLNLQVDAYLKALADEDLEAQALAADALIGEAGRTNGNAPDDSAAKPRFVRAMQNIFAAANRRVFAVCLWFGLLGPVGALLYRFTCELAQPANRQDGFTAAAQRLRDILEWLPARLFALGFALSGNLTHSLSAWQHGQRAVNMAENDNLLRAAGTGALQFDVEQHGQPAAAEEEREWIDEARGLIGRTFLVWLAVLAAMTLAGAVT